MDHNTHTPPVAPPQPHQPTNALAIASLVLAFFIPVVGLVLAIIALHQIKKEPQAGKGLAIGGLIVSIVYIVLGVLAFVLLIFGAIVAQDQVTKVSNNINTQALSAEDQAIENITRSYKKLVPDTLNDQGEDVAVDDTDKKIDTAQVESISVPSDIYANFMDDVTDLQDAMVRALTDNGLTQTGQLTETSTSYMADYSNEHVYCNLAVTKFYSRLNCAKNSTFDAALADSKDATAVLASTYKDVSSQPQLQIDYWQVSEDGGVTGMAVRYHKQASGVTSPTTYIAKIDDTWKVLGQSEATPAGEAPLSCTILQATNLHRVFVDLPCAEPR